MVSTNITTYGLHVTVTFHQDNKKGINNQSTVGKPTWQIPILAARWNPPSFKQNHNKCTLGPSPDHVNHDLWKGAQMSLISFHPGEENKEGIHKHSNQTTHLLQIKVDGVDTREISNEQPLVPSQKIFTSP